MKYEIIKNNKVVDSTNSLVEAFSKCNRNVGCKVTTANALVAIWHGDMLFQDIEAFKLDTFIELENITKLDDTHFDTPVGIMQYDELNDRYVSDCGEYIPVYTRFHGSVLGIAQDL